MGHEGCPLKHFSLDVDGSLAPTSSGKQRTVGLAAMSAMLCKVAVVLIRHYREILGHAVREHVLSALRQKFWILNARAVTCRALRQCVTCRKRHEGVMKQMMGDLPKARLVPRAAIHLHRALAPSTSREAKVLRKSMGASSFVSPRGPYTLRMQDH